MSESYDQHDCPQCKVTNVVSSEEESDEPAILCWNCGKKFWRFTDRELDDSDLTDVMDDWDPTLSADENLVHASAEEGKPTEDYDSGEYEKFLEADCDIDPKQTWRGFILERFKFMNGGKEFWAEKRARRVALVEQFLKEPNYFGKPMAEAFHKHGIDCKKILTDSKKKKKNGGSRIGGVDWVQFYRETKAVLLYISGIGWYEIKHEDRKEADKAADDSFKPPPHAFEYKAKRAKAKKAKG